MQNVNKLLNITPIQNRRLKMGIIVLLLLAFAVVLCFAASRNIGTPAWSLGWFGLAFFILAELLRSAYSVGPVFK